MKRYFIFITLLIIGNFVESEAFACTLNSINTAVIGPYNVTNNCGVIISSSGSVTSGINGLVFTGTSATGGISNSGTLRSITYTSIGLTNSSLTGGIVNTGIINTAVHNGIYLNNSSLTGGINNTGSIYGADSGIILVLGGRINGGIQNSGSISTSGANTGGATAGNAGIYIGSTTSVDLITNTGTITGFYGINNLGILGTLANAQGGDGLSALNTALTYNGTLPTNYNVILGSSSHYGQVVFTNPSGTTNFGIDSSSSVNTKLYRGVLQGLTSSNVGSTRTGSFNTWKWTLALQNGSLTIWDLILTGGSTADTQSSLSKNISALHGVYAIENAAIVKSLSYDCRLFSINKICVSVGGSNFGISGLINGSSSNNSSMLTIAYSPSSYAGYPIYRIGGFLDHNLSSNFPGDIVRLGINRPLLGLFAAWNQRTNGTGGEIKLSTSYGKKSATVTREIIGTSEPGSGTSNIRSHGAQLIAKYGFNLSNKVILSPYAGIRYTHNNMAGYTEVTTSSVTAPLTYSPLKTSAVTALAGLGISMSVSPKAKIYASIGVETDTNNKNGTYSANGITGLTSINFNTNPVKTRSSASLGAYYDLTHNQRLDLYGIYRQEPFQGLSSTAVMVNYAIGM
jgi:hypothetical protein